MKILLYKQEEDLLVNSDDPKTSEVSKRREEPSLATFDKIMDHPDRIFIPERYNPHLEIEDDDTDDETKREKAEDIRLKIYQIY